MTRLGPGKPLANEASWTRQKDQESVVASSGPGLTLPRVVHPSFSVDLIGIRSPNVRRLAGDGKLKRAAAAIMMPSEYRPCDEIDLLTERKHCREKRRLQRRVRM